MEEDKDALFEPLEDLDRKCGSRAEDLRRPGPDARTLHSSRCHVTTVLFDVDTQGSDVASDQLFYYLKKNLVMFCFVLLALSVDIDYASTSQFQE